MLWYHVYSPNVFYVLYGNNSHINCNNNSSDGNSTNNSVIVTIVIVIPVLVLVTRISCPHTVHFAIFSSALTREGNLPVSSP